MVCEVVKISDYIQVNMSDILLNFFQLIPIIEDHEFESDDRSYLVDLYNML